VPELTCIQAIKTLNAKMPDFDPITDADLAQARQDPAFRHQLVANNLELLLAKLNRLRSSGPDVVRTRQIREGVDLAVRLAELLQRVAHQADRKAV
jgi:hypothetical protein